MLTTGGILALALLSFVSLVICSPHRLLYDETFFVSYIPLLHKYGLTTEFLNSLPAAPGPLYSFLHIALEPLTHLEPVRMRLVNVFLLALVATTLMAWLKQEGRHDYGVTGCSILVMPMTWVVGGMALSEMPAMLFVTVSLYLQLRGLRALDAGQSAAKWLLASAVCLGVAVWGRQPYLLLVSVPALAATLEHRLRAAACAFAGVVLAMTIPLFLVWKGLVPPSNHSIQGISVTHGLTSLGYTGICFFLLAPRFRGLPVKTLIGIIALTTAANALLGGFALYPVRSFVERHVPPPAVPAYGNLCGSLLLSCGAVFLALSLRTIWESRGDLRRLTINAGVLCLAAAPLFDAHQYSSRYTAMSLPYLILASEPWREWRLKTVLTAAAGCGLGYLSLFGYFSR
jgi:hypothetical protein